MNNSKSIFVGYKQQCAGKYIYKLALQQRRGEVGRKKERTEERTRIKEQERKKES